MCVSVNTSSKEWRKKKELNKEKEEESSMNPRTSVSRRMKKHETKKKAHTHTGSVSDEENPPWTEKKKKVINTSKLKAISAFLHWKK